MDGTVTVAGFTVILVKPKENKSSSELNWWLKKSTDRHSISVTGVPLYATKACVKKVFLDCGPIEDVFFQSSREMEQPSHLPQFQMTVGYQQVTIKFKKEAGARKALKMKYDDKYTLYGAEEKLIPVTDIWTNDLKTSYNIDTSSLLNSCTEYMQIYDNRKEKEEKANRKMADEPDEDGWTTVTRNKFSRPPKAVKAHELKRLKKKKSTATLLHFYKNQINDSKMQRIKELKARFEEDKKKIQEMKQQRKFKPY